MDSENNLTAKSGMLIRKPAETVFEALADPDITSKFWFTRGSARLKTGTTVEWEWEQFGVQAAIEVKEVKPNRLIRFRWPADGEGSSYRTVEISFEPKPEETTLVRVVEKGFDPEDERLIEQIAGQTGGWALVLSALKAYLEHDIILKVISDHDPG